MSSTRIVFTDAARDVVEQVKRERTGKLALVLGNGCCDSSAPFLFADYLAGPTEQPFGELEGVDVFIDELVARTLEGTEVVIDATKGSAPDSFSCESELGYRLTLEPLPAA